MPFRPNQVQFAVLRALAYLECDGCPVAAADGRPTTPTVRFSGVPETFLSAWVQVGAGKLASAVAPLRKRGLIRHTKRRVWPVPRTLHGFVLPDGRVVQLERKLVTSLEAARMLQQQIGGTLTRGPKTKRRGASQDPPLYLVEARYEGRDEAGRRVTYSCRELQMVDAGQFYSITRRGLRLLDSTGDNFEPDELVRLSQVAAFVGLSKRTLERYVKADDLPQPDVRGGRGHPHKWYWSNLRRRLAKFSKKLLPESFPGSRGG